MSGTLGGLLNVSNWSLPDDIFMDHSELPERQWSEYAEITFLASMFLVGAPLNLVALGRSRTISRKRSAYTACRSGENVANRRTFTSLPTPSRSTTTTAGSVRGGRNASVSQFKRLQIHLTVANLMIICIYGLSQICWLITIQWYAGDFACRLVKFAHTFCFYATSNMVAMIAIDRLLVTIHIDRQRLHTGASRCLNAATAIAWLLACGSSLPQAFFWQAYAPFPDYPEWEQCVTSFLAARHQASLLYPFPFPDHPSNRSLLQKHVILDEPTFYEDLYGGVHLALVFWFPALIVVCSYGVIVGKFHKKINQSNRETIRRHKRAQEKEAAQFRQKLSVWHQNSSASEDTAGKAGSVDQETTIMNGKFDQNKSRDLSSTKMMGLPVIMHSSRAVSLRRFSKDVTVHTLTRAKRTTLKKTMWILSAYVLCWSPYNILELWRYFDTTFENSYLEFLSNLIVLNAVLNPLIYRVTL